MSVGSFYKFPTLLNIYYGCLYVNRDAKDYKSGLVKSQAADKAIVRDCDVSSLLTLESFPFHRGLKHVYTIEWYCCLKLPPTLESRDEKYNERLHIYIFPNVAFARMRRQ